MWNLICTAVGYVLQFCYAVTQNYGLALILLTILWSLISLPSSISQQKQQNIRRRILPQELAIRARYGKTKDRQKNAEMANEIQALYKSAGIRATAGCLPLLLQLPLIFAIYSVIRSPLTYLVGWNYEEKTHYVLTRAMALFNDGRPFNTELQAVGAIKNNISHFTDLIRPSELPNFDFLGLDLSVAPGFQFDIYILIPILTFVIMYGTMELSRRLSPDQTAQNPNAEKSMTVMNIVMPLMSAWIATTVPCALGIYWMAASLVSAVRQFAVRLLFSN